MKAARGRGQTERCLGELTAALTDGELSSAARDAALSHLVNCDECRGDVAGQRAVKARLRGLPDPGLPTGLFDRLLAVDAPPSSGDRSGPEILEVFVLPGALPALPALPVLSPRHRLSRAELPGLGRAGSSSPVRAPARARRSVRFAVAGGASVLALGVSAFALGGGRPAPTVVPSVDSFSPEYASLSGNVPFGGTAATTVSFRRALVGSKR